MEQRLMEELDRKMMDEIDRVLARNEKPKMMDKPVPCYMHEYSRHPESIRVSFDDGSTAIYDLRVDQPAPVIVENIKIIRKWKGYVNQPMQRRKRK